MSATQIQVDKVLRLAWTLISIILLILTWGLGASRSASLAAFVATIAGAVLPIFGLLVPCR